ncbi:MAG: hypothetical protein LC708_03040, partial [Actinobacteria bacterium]|nr:hypothetical protein [Actinomycetota bacterium]
RLRPANVAGAIDAMVLVALFALAVAYGASRTGSSPWARLTSSRSEMKRSTVYGPATSEDRPRTDIGGSR